MFLSGSISKETLFDIYMNRAMKMKYIPIKEPKNKDVRIRNFFIINSFSKLEINEIGLYAR